MQWLPKALVFSGMGTVATSFAVTAELVPAFPGFAGRLVMIGLPVAIVGWVLLERHRKQTGEDPLNDEKDG